MILETSINAVAPVFVEIAKFVIAIIFARAAFDLLANL